MINSINDLIEVNIISAISRSMQQAIVSIQRSISQLFPDVKME